MFKKYPDKMRMEPTPERVFCICKLVEQNRYGRKDLIDAFTLGNGDDKNIANYSIAVAENDLEVLKKVDQDYLLNESTNPFLKDALRDPMAFRRYVSSCVFQKKNTTFYLFSRWVIGQNDNVNKLNRWENLAATAEKDVPELAGINENDVLGWRFWASYLGLGYLSGTTFIPNMKIRLQDVLIAEFDKWADYDTPIAAKEFIDWIAPKIPEVNYGIDLPLAFSAGLKTLNDLNLITLESRRDTEKIKLYQTDDGLNDFSHITIRKEISL